MSARESKNEIEPPDVSLWLERLSQGDRSVWPDLLRKYDGYLHRLLAGRIDSRLKSRVDILDLIQETHLQLTRGIEDFILRRPMSFKLWVRSTACECVIQQFRKHVQVQARSVNREQAFQDQSSILLSQQLIGNLTSPSGKAAQREDGERVRQVVEQLTERDREIILLRTYEGLSNAEASCVLAIAQDACRKRYTRALLRLRDLLTEYNTA